VDGASFHARRGAGGILPRGCAFLPRKKGLEGPRERKYVELLTKVLAVRSLMRRIKRGQVYAPIWAAGGGRKNRAKGMAKLSVTEASNQRRGGGDFLRVKNKDEPPLLDPQGVRN